MRILPYCVLALVDCVPQNVSHLVMAHINLPYTCTPFVHYSTCIQVHIIGLCMHTDIVHTVHVLCKVGTFQWCQILRQCVRRTLHKNKPFDFFRMLVSTPYQVIATCRKSQSKSSKLLHQQQIESLLEERQWTVCHCRLKIDLLKGNIYCF